MKDLKKVSNKSLIKQGNSGSKAAKQELNERAKKQALKDIKKETGVRIWK